MARCRGCGARAPSISNPNAQVPITWLPSTLPAEATALSRASTRPRPPMIAQNEPNFAPFARAVGESNHGGFFSPTCQYASRQLKFKTTMIESYSSGPTLHLLPPVLYNVWCLAPPISRHLQTNHGTWGICGKLMSTPIDQQCHS